MIDRDIPQIDRRTALLYFLAKTGPLQRSQVESMANVLYEDTQEGQIRNLADIAKRSSIALPQARRFFGNPAWVLSRLAVEYQQPEFEQAFSFINKGDIPRFLDEQVAGGGPPRPLVRDLLNLCSVGEMHVDIKKLFAGDEQYWITNRGDVHVKVIDVIFRYSDVLRDPSGLLVAGEYRARLIHQDLPPRESLWRIATRLLPTFHSSQ